MKLPVIPNLRRKGELVMKSSILAVAVISCLLTFAVAVRAQQAAPQMAKPDMKMHNMMGCLTKTDANSYLIMNADPKGPKTIGVVSPTADLAPMSVRRSKSRALRFR